MIGIENNTPEIVSKNKINYMKKQKNIKKRIDNIEKTKK